MPEYVNTAALVLRTTEYSETSQVVTFWTRERGKVRGIVKGARRGSKSGGAGLDMLNLCDIVFVPKPPPALCLVTSWQVQDTLRRLRTDLSLLYAALYASELLNAATEDADPDAELFDLTLRFFEAMEGGTKPYPALLRFETLLLSHVGLAPHVDHCAACGEPAGDPVRFSPAVGGLLCERCAERQGDAFPLSGAAAEAIHRLSEPAPPSGLRMSGNEILEIRRVLDEHIVYHLGRRLEMRKHIEPPAAQPMHAGEETRG